MEPIFEGTGVALVLPMFEDGSIDYEGYKRQVQRMIDGGVKALLVNGTTGEPATIDIEDAKKELVDQNDSKQDNENKNEVAIKTGDDLKAAGFMISGLLATAFIYGMKKKG